jgi:hypothetical protein
VSQDQAEAERPERNNCYGQFVAPSGLAVVAALFPGPEWRTSRYVSGYSGWEELRLDGPGLELETDPKDAQQHFIAGRVEPGERGRGSLRHVSARLTGAGVVHRLELYTPGTNTLIGHHEHGWSGAAAW